MPPLLPNCTGGRTGIVKAAPAAIVPVRDCTFFSLSAIFHPASSTGPGEAAVGGAYVSVVPYQRMRTSCYFVSPGATTATASSKKPSLQLAYRGRQPS